MMCDWQTLGYLNFSPKTTNTHIRTLEHYIIVHPRCVKVSPLTRKLMFGLLVALSMNYAQKERLLTE